MKIEWMSRRSGPGHERWYSLEDLNLTDISCHGVYVIRRPGPKGKVVRVGQGNVPSRLDEHCRDPEIQAYGPNLLVTWAAVPKASRDGVERFLANVLKPVVGVRFPQARPIPVNPPPEPRLPKPTNDGRRIVLVFNYARVTV